MAGKGSEKGKEEGRKTKSRESPRRTRPTRTECTEDGERRLADAGADKITGKKEFASEYIHAILFSFKEPSACLSLPPLLSLSPPTHHYMQMTTSQSAPSPSQSPPAATQQQDRPERSRNAKAQARHR